ncbi:hypothetical protein O181_041039 [Austropuccinia psidii MF-1]|uniref:Protein phosphatase inhibitor 2 n=1 Tax=Austropuccinia psidii MF-1 TaxID=1389203 RepID=A0A9Q3HG39_9BASI|nr:hypothetical protein [Austropuccinia psidii MF-1]
MQSINHVAQRYFYFEMCNNGTLPSILSNPRYLVYLAEQLASPENANHPQQLGAAGNSSRSKLLNRSGIGHLSLLIPSLPQHFLLQYPTFRVCVSPHFAAFVSECFCFPRSFFVAAVADIDRRRRYNNFSRMNHNPDPADNRCERRIGRSDSSVRPKGILKNKLGSEQESRSPHLTWDEPNLALNDLNRDSKMKITEPKTPFVRYNPDTDEVMNLDSIPDFDLGGVSSSSQPDCQSPQQEISCMENDTPVCSIPIARRLSSSSRRGSGSTERRQVFVQPPTGPSTSAGDHALDDDDEDDDQGNLDPDMKAKHDAFVLARKGHYGNEAEAMKRARQLAEREDMEADASTESDFPSEDAASDLSQPPNGI